MKFIRYNENVIEEYKILNIETFLNTNTRIWTMVIDNKKYCISITIPCINENKNICDMIDRLKFNLDAVEYYNKVYPHKPKYEYRIEDDK